MGEPLEFEAVVYGLSALETEIVSEDDSEVAGYCYGALKLVRAALRRRASRAFWLLGLRLPEEREDDDDG
jgi:hypothetical protein